MPVFWWVGLDLVFLVGRVTSSGVVWGVCELSMTLRSLSSDGGGVLLSCYSFVIRRPALEFAGCWMKLGHSVDMEISGRALTV